MEANFVSLFVIALIAALAPLVARLIPKGMVPEAVILLIAGAFLGPYMAGLINLTEPIQMLSELGLAFLFLLAGYEINPKSLSGSQGKRGVLTWAVSFAAAFAVCLCSRVFGDNQIELIAMAIALTTTALGTLMPILKERELVGTPVGEAVLSYGTWGELAPVLMMALLLGTRAKWMTLLILAAFVAVCIVAALLPSKARKAGHAAYRFLISKRNGSSQTVVRVTILLLIGLVTISAVFDLDIVLGAFAAGFVLRYVIPEGNKELEHKLDAIGYGFFIPLFFVVSGAKIDLAAVLSMPQLLVGFIIMLLLIRGLPIVISLSCGKAKEELSMHNRLSVAFYCTTALPLIVAVTSVAVNAGAMQQETAGVLVAAGAVTVFLMPLLASLTYRVADAKPVEAVVEIAEHPQDAKEIIREHMSLERMLRIQERQSRRKAHAKGTAQEDPAWEDIAFALQLRGERRKAAEAAIEEARQYAAAHYVGAAGVIQHAGLHTAEDVPANEQDMQPAAADTAAAGNSKRKQSKRELSRRKIARKAVMEYRKRMRELGR